MSFCNKLYNKSYQVLQVLRVRAHLRFSCLVVLPLRSLTLAAQAANATAVAVHIYNKHKEDPGLDALREQEVRRQQGRAGREEFGVWKFGVCLVQPLFTSATRAARCTRVRPRAPRSQTPRARARPSRGPAGQSRRSLPPHQAARRALRLPKRRTYVGIC